MRIRRAAAFGPGRVVSLHEIGHGAISVRRHLPVDWDLRASIGRQLLDGGQHIAVELREQGLDHGQGIRRQIGVVIMHEVVLMNRQLGLRTAILIFHPDVMLGTASSTPANGRFRQRHVRRRRARKEIGIVVL